MRPRFSEVEVARVSKREGVGSRFRQRLTMWQTQDRNRLPIPSWRTLALALIALLAAPAVARAIVVLPKGSSKPVMGYLVREDERTIVVREILPDGKPREQTFQRDQIDELLVTVSPERLAELDPARPQLYREYAEELAEKHRDPEARDMALRLYHMAAVLGEGSLRRGSILGLAALARTPQEERRFRAAAYLYDPEHDAAVLAEGAGVKLAAAPTATEPLAELATALRLVRQGRGSQAKAIFEKPSSREPLAALAGIVSGEELLAACTAKNLSGEQLYKLVKAELAIERSLAGRPGGSAADDFALQPASWAASIKSHGLSALPPLALETLTEFDPRACVYRDGKWVRPG